MNKIKSWLRKRKILTSQEPIIGQVVKYYPKSEVAVIKLLTKIKTGDKIVFVNKHNLEENFHQNVPELWNKNKIVKSGKTGEEVSFKTTQKARQKMIVLKY